MKKEDRELLKEFVFERFNFISNFIETSITGADTNKELTVQMADSWLSKNPKWHKAFADSAGITSFILNETYSEAEKQSILNLINDVQKQNQEAFRVCTEQSLPIETYDRIDNDIKRLEYLRKVVTNISNQ